MLTEAQKAHYAEKGWVVVEGVYTPEEADRIAKLANAYCDKQQEAAGLTVRDANGELIPRKLGHPFMLDAEFRGFVLDARLRELLLEFMDGEEPVLLEDQLFMKPPRHGGPKPYHQDNAYFRCHPDDHVITAWIALDDVDEANGCLRYIDGSHRLEILPHETQPGAAYDMVPAEELIDLKRESLAPVGKGGVIFHHSKALHTSHRNDSDRWRRGYATHWVTPEVTCDNQTLDHAVFRTDLYKETVAAASAA